MHDGDYENIPREMITELMENHGTLEETRRRAYEYAERARKNLEFLPKTEYREALAQIPTYMIERNN